MPTLLELHSEANKKPTLAVSHFTAYQLVINQNEDSKIYIFDQNHIVFLMF